MEIERYFDTTLFFVTLFSMSVLVSSIGILIVTTRGHIDILVSIYYFFLHPSWKAIVTLLIPSLLFGFYPYFCGLYIKKLGLGRY